MGAALAIAQALGLALQALQEVKGIIESINSRIATAQAEGRDLTNDEVEAITAEAAKLRPQQQG